MSKKKLAGIIVACIIAIIAAILINRTHALTTDINPPGAGSVSPSGGEYKSGALVTLNATPASSYTFDHWSGNASGTTPTITITMDSDKSLTANFKAIYTLTTSVSPPEAGSVSPSGGKYKSGALVTLNATPASGYTFDYWSGNVTDTSCSITITMTCNMNITAHFSRVPPKLIILSQEAKAERAFPHPDLVHLTVKGQAQNEGFYTIRSVAIVVKFYTRRALPMDYQGWWLVGEASSSYYDIEPDQIFDFEVNGDFPSILPIEPRAKYEISVVDIQY
jgi:uncharacterized repeat protein (TIGR02543 family)